MRFAKFSLVISLIFLPATIRAAAEHVGLPKNVTPQHYQISLTPHSDALTFDAQVKIDIQINEPTTDITLNAADLTFKTVNLKSVGEPTISLDNKQQTANFKFSKTISPGKYVLEIDYSGRIYKSAAGLFALDYKTSAGQKRALFTQFEAADARRFVPCWDEPAIKATFELNATVPETDMPVFNMPAISQEKVSDGLKRVHFGISPKMSTYLLFFSLGDFERISQKVRDIDVGVIVKRGDTEKAKFALESTAKLIPYFEAYFGVKYPLPKLDLIAAPGTSQFFSAMENWGAILYFERAVLFDPAISTEAERRRVFAVIAHETAHQWFGNLVTMSWWDALWLNEGFASWMEATAVDHFYPEWKVWLGEQGDTSDAMYLDAKLGTHPIIQPIADVLQASQAFDKITYAKGSAVVRMLEQYVGPDNFRTGVQAYMKKYAYQNTVSDDLWREIDAVSKLKLTPVAHDFTLQAGVPLIDVKSSPNAWTLEQARFAIDSSTPPTRKWGVPVSATDLGTNKVWQGIVSNQSPQSLPVMEGSGHLINPSRSSYYRIRYDDRAFEVIAQNFEKLPAEAQLGLIDDTLALGTAGFVPMTQFLSLSERMSSKLEPKVLAAYITGLYHLEGLYEGLPTQATYQVFVRKQLQQLFKNVGWTAKAGEPVNTAELRSSLTYALGVVRDDEIQNQATKYFNDFLKDQKSLTSELRKSVLAIVAMNADEKTWAQLHSLARNSASPLEQQEFYGLLASSKSPALAQKTIQLAFSKEIPETAAPALLRRVAFRFPKLVFEALLQNKVWMSQNLEPQVAYSYLPAILVNSYDKSVLEMLLTYARANIPKSAMQATQKAEAAIRFNIDKREKRLPEIDAWMKMRTP